MRIQKFIPILFISIFLVMSSAHGWSTGVYTDATFLKGIVYADWSLTGFQSANSWNSLSKIHATGATWISIVPTWYMANGSSTAIARDAAKTPSDVALVQAIRWAKMLGMKVMLKPHVDCLDSTWRGAITPANWTTWFGNGTAYVTPGTVSGGYKNFILHYAEIARDEAVDMFCVGTELIPATTNAANNAMWTTLINNYIKPITGSVPLTYASNASNAYSADEYANTNLDSCIWNNVDIVGVDVYFPLTNGTSPALASLEAAWNGNKDGQNLLNNIAGLKARWPAKQLIFTEIGYRSYAGTNIQPFTLADPPPGAYDGTEQANCYEAAFRKNSEQAWWHGAFWWDWEIDPDGGGVGNRWYIPQNKPAETVVANWYGMVPVNTMVPTATPSTTDPAIYHFEGGDTMNWAQDTSIGPQTQSIANSASRSYLGNHSTALNVIFAAGTFQKGAMSILDIAPSKSVVTAHVLAPLSAPESIVKIYMNDFTWGYFESAYVTLVPGEWTTVTWNLNSFVYNNSGALKKLGVVIQSSGDYKAYTGSYYVDSIDVPGVPTPVPTNTPCGVGPPDTTLYNFEGGIQGWTTITDQVTGTAGTGVRQFLGCNSLAMLCHYVSPTAAAGGTASTQAPLVTDLTGRTLVAHVYVPLGAPTGIGGYIYIKSGAGWVWQNSTWTNLTIGGWTDLYFNTAYPAYTAAGVTNLAQIKEIGVKVAPPGNWAGTLWDGIIYIDSVDWITGSGPTPTNTTGQSPTNTPTRTGTRTATTTATPTLTWTLGTTLTFTPTRTGTPSVSASATLSPTATRTRTGTNTPIATSTCTITPTSTPSRTATATNTAGGTASGTRTATATYTASGTATGTRTATSSRTATPTITETPTETTYAGTPTDTYTNSPTPTITDTVTASPTEVDTPACVCAADFGKMNVGAGTSNNPDAVDVNKYTLIENAVVRSISVNIASTSGGAVRMGIYSDNAGVPGDLLVETAPVTVSTGWNTLNLPDTLLSAGDYWMALQSENDVIVVYDIGAAGVDVYMYPYTFGPFPYNMTGTSTWTWLFSMYVNYCPVICGSPTDTPTVTMTPTITPTFILSCACPDKLGMTYQGPTGVNVAQNFMISNWYPMMENGAAMSMEFYTTSGSGSARLAIYSNSLPGLTPGTPLNLICESAQFAVVPGWNIVPVPQTDLAANTIYWLAFITNATTGVLYDMGVAGDMYFKSSAFGVFPGVFGSGSPSAEMFSMNVNYCPAVCPLTATPTVTSTPTVTDTEIVTPTDTPAGTLTDTPVVSPTNTPAGTLTNTPVITATDTATIAVFSPTNTPVNTVTNTPFPTPSFTDTPVDTATVTLTLTLTLTQTPTPTLTRTPAFPTLTFTPTAVVGLSKFEITDPIAFPNPANLSAGITIGFNPTQDCGSVTVSIYTAAMRLIRKISVADAPAAPSPAAPVKRVISITDIKGLSNGVYYYVIAGVSKIDGKTKRSVIKKLVILK